MARPYRVLFSLPDGAQSSLLFGTKLYELLTSNVDIEWTFVSPLAGDARFAERFHRPRVQVRNWPSPVWRRGEYLTEVLRQELRKLGTNNSTSDIFARRAAWLSAGRRHFLNRAARAIHRRPWLQNGLNAVADRRPGHAGWNVEFLDEVAPDAVVLASGAVKLQEVPLARAARRTGLPIFGIIPSWDNLSSKGSPVDLCDRLAVWSLDMQTEATELYGFPRGNLSIVGPLPFDPHAQRPSNSLRERFFRAAGLDPRKRLIVYTSVTPAVCPFSAAYAELLADLIAENRFCSPCQLWVRLHPQDDFSAFDKLALRRNVHVERAGGYLGAASGHRAIDHFDASKSDLERLTQTMAFADIVVNIASTTTLDACALDRPVVNLAFNAAAAGDVPFDIGEYYSLEHYRPVTESGAVAVVRSVSELVRTVDESLQQPEARSEARKSLYRRYDPFGDGRAAERLAGAIQTFLAHFAASTGSFRRISGRRIAA